MSAPRISPAVADALFAGLLVVAELVTVLPKVDQPHEVVGLAGALVVLASVALRSRAPMAMALLTGIGISVAAISTDTLDSLWLLAAALVIAFSVGFSLRGPRRVLAAVAVFAGTFVLQSQVSQWVVEVIISPLVIIGLPLVIGVVAGRSRDQAVRLRQLTEELERERDHHAQALLLAERQRIARELHDVIAHSLSIIVVQAGAVEGALHQDSPLRGQVADIRRTGRSALAESRRILAAVRSPGPPSEEAVARPQPDLGDLAGLVESASAQLAVVGDARTSSPGLGLAVYRIVQEALTNVRRHAGPEARATVTLEWSPTALVAVVEDTGTGGDVPRDDADAGHGLIGIRERVTMYGGTLSAGPRDDAPGWRVRAALPLLEVAV